MTRYMGQFYWTRTDHELAVLRSKKYNRLSALRRQVQTYTVLKEVRALTEQMRWIDAVLAARKEQSELF